MEIPVINRISDFEASLQNPSFVSQALTFSSAEKILQAYSFWKWGALILALVASFSTVINRVKILIVRIRNRYVMHSKPNLISQQSYDSDCESESDVSCSSSSSMSDDEEDEVEDEQETTTTSYSWRSDEDFRVKGVGYYDNNDQGQNRNLRRRRNSSFEDILASWSEFKNGKNVVKLWDNLGFGFGLNLECNARNCVSLYDMNKEMSLFSIFGEKSDIPAVSTSSSSPAVIVSAESNVLKVWDTRIGSRLPEILAEWKPILGKFVGMTGGSSGGAVEKVYVRDDLTGRLTVGDMRKVKSPLENATEADVDTWWDADGVSSGGVE
ncbi:uncharacterized protein LOC126671189 [Mercurialis annua]|uniref:uncharacterized protein LOC126671189 n=1 Tax=Mercurialis annua TaxID=3986 RepID=UPI00216074E0|nr:uncharacterized protein LOC126671189 [Mercurialis annua]